ncbi:anti-sigma factor [Castellaniella sp. GW247-6E4]|uniref:anti-sigma factor family protein n=1 Tax=Castellaniella sp. GW247-6E4 TaxID=3140380 RepID=UPI003314D178
MRESLHSTRSPPAFGEDLRLLSALVDDELSETERAAISSRLAGDPAAAVSIAHYRAQNAALKALFPLPHDMPALFVRRRAPWWQWAGMAAAGLMLGLALAWAPSRFGIVTPAFAHHADMAYAVYAPEQRHPVEVEAAQQAHLAGWLSKRLNHPLSVPSLQEYGYALMGGRLLPDESGPAAQFMYQNQAGERLALYIAKFPKKQTAVRLLRDGARRTFYWADRGMGYALSGNLAETNLRAIALDVCATLGGRLVDW